MHFNRLNTLWWLAALILALLGLSACNPSAGLRPVEAEQIENVVKDHFVRNSDIPDYTVQIEANTAEWVRVRIEPAGVDTEPQPSTVYLHKEPGRVEAAKETDVQPGNTGPIRTTTGWTIVLGPQIEFSEAELDEAGVPETIRP